MVLNSRSKQDNGQSHRLMPGTKLAFSTNSLDNNTIDSHLFTYQQILNREDEDVKRVVSDNIYKHRNWNQGWIDRTWHAISPSTAQPLQAILNYNDNLTGPQLDNVTESKDDESEEEGLSVGDFGKCITDYSQSSLSRTRKSTIFHRRRGRGGRMFLSRTKRLQSAERKSSILVSGSQDTATTGMQPERTIGNGHHRSEFNSIYFINHFREKAIGYRILFRSLATRDITHQPTSQIASRSY